MMMIIVTAHFIKLTICHPHFNKQVTLTIDTEHKSWELQTQRRILAATVSQHYCSRAFETKDSPELLYYHNHRHIQWNHKALKLQHTHQFSFQNTQIKNCIKFPICTVADNMTKVDHISEWIQKYTQSIRIKHINKRENMHNKLQKNTDISVHNV